SADSANWGAGEPALTTTLRGLVDCVVEVRTLDHGVHSGMYGGVVPDALTTLCRLLATLHDEQGNVAVAGLVSRAGPDLTYPPARLAAESGILPGVDYLGAGSVVERMWTRPACAVLAIDTTAVADASNTLLPTARAKVSLRVAPGDSAAAARTALTTHLQAHAPWGAQVTVIPGDVAEPSSLPDQGPYVDAARSALTEAFGVPVVTVGQGGSIPLVAELAAAYPDATILVTAVADPDSRAHGADESLGLADFRSACQAEARMLQAFAAVRSGPEQ
ncbi:MAG: peptidase dimerization domain-containing protein, partial [Actinomycetes bacterium]